VAAPMLPHSYCRGGARAGRLEVALCISAVACIVHVLALSR
jgi:hypothetical protein